ncbi:MAG: hypothetical protein ACJ8H8_21560 [Geminicoccaceae bacterium]
MPRTISLIATLVLALTPASPTPAVAGPVLQQVLLSTSGVGYLGFAATADADGRVRLTVPLTQVDDILKSLTVLAGDGTVRSVGLLGPTPQADLFRDVPFGQGDLVDLPTLLLSLRGAEVEVRGPATLRGRILTVAPEETVTGEARTVRYRLSLMAADGIRSVLLDTVEGLSFTDDALQLQVNRVLSRLGENRGRQERELEIALSGSAGRTVGLGYLAEMPLWKASYRLVARSGDGLLQGWAILENASGQDWHDVQVTLIGGSPRALRQALFASYFVPRPEVPVQEAAPKQELGAARVRAMAAPPEAAMESADVAPPAAPPGLEATTPRELTAQTLFPLPQPVTLAVGHTVMAPLVDRSSPIERVAVFSAAEAGDHPGAALRLRNTTGASLPAGLATLYEQLPEGGLTFLGDAPLPQLAPGADKLLVYGLDGNIDVAVRTDTDGRVGRARIADGVLELTRVEQQHFAYAVTPHFAGPARSFVLEQPLPAGWRVAAPPDTKVDGDQLRVDRNLDASVPLDLAVVLERPVVQRLALVDLDTDALQLEFKGVTPPAKLREVLARLQTLSAAVADSERRIQQLKARQGELTQDQDRLRQNLQAVPAGSDLARRYIKALEASEDELAALSKQLESLRSESERATAERLQFVRSATL